MSLNSIEHGCVQTVDMLSLSLCYGYVEHYSERETHAHCAHTVIKWTLT